MSTCSPVQDQKNFVQTSKCFSFYLELCENKFRNLFDPVNSNTHFEDWTQLKIVYGNIIKKKTIIYFLGCILVNEVSIMKRLHSDGHDLHQLILTELTEHKKTMTCDDVSPGPGLGQAQYWGRAKPVNGIWTLPSW